MSDPTTPSKPDNRALVDRSPFWNPGSDESLDDYLKKNKPSMLVDKGDRPWTWVHSERQPQKAQQGTSEDKEKTLDDATMILNKATEQVEAIQSNPDIPERASKAKGKSKKQHRDEVLDKTVKDLKDLSIKSGQTCGKWLIYRSLEGIDSTFALIARNLIDGELSNTPAMTVKSANVPQGHEEDKNHQLVICVYYLNVYDKDDGMAVLKALLSLGIRPTSVKTDLYTEIGITPTHPSKIKSSIFTPTDFMTKDELAAALDEVSKKSKDQGDKPKEEANTGEKRKPEQPELTEVQKVVKKKATTSRQAAAFADSDDED